MREKASTVDQGKTDEGVGLGAFLGRFMWLLVGPMLLGIVVWQIVVRGNGWLTPVDGAFGVVVVLMIIGRWLEVRSGRALTALGEPVTVEHFRRYVCIMVLVAAAIWATANVVANRVLR